MFLPGESVRVAALAFANAPQRIGWELREASKDELWSIGSLRPRGVFTRCYLLPA